MANNDSKLDASKISVISSTKVDKKQLVERGDSNTIRQQARDAEAAGAGKDAAPVTRKEKYAAVAAGAPTAVTEKRCNTCCMLFGGGVSTAMSVLMSSTYTAVFAYRDHHRLNISIQRMLRQVGWIALPASLVGTTLHLFVNEAMWSSRRNTYGIAWMKSIGMNTFCWTSAVVVCTLAWRRGLRLTKRGQRIFYKYPIPAERLETRLLENPDMFFTGMGWTYWMLGVFTGQMGFAATTTFCVWQNKIHYSMSPVGGYAAACTPWWRRAQIAKAANFDLSTRS
jgi:hypothetical protein